MHGTIRKTGFRFLAMQMAYKLGISGCVKYLYKDVLFIEAEGEEESIQRFIEWCRHGPEMSSIKKVKLQEIDLRGYNSFEISHASKSRNSPQLNILSVIKSIFSRVKVLFF